MDKSRKLVLGLAGFGTVGTGLVQILAMNREALRRRTGCDISVKSILVRDTSRRRAVDAPEGAQFTTDYTALVNDPEIDLVVELIGGTTRAKEIITAALNAGKHVVTANKALLAEHGNELFTLAAEKGLHLRYEASIAGGIPIVETLKESLAGNRFEKLAGILNGTANFILTEMTATGMDFDTALALAQDKGFAEADPTLDIEGIDAAHKLNLLIRLAYGVDYPFAALPVSGITKVTPLDIQFAKSFGCQIRLIGLAREVEGKIEAWVSAALVPENYLLAQVIGPFNAIRLTGNAVGPVMLHGQGAGDLPTGSAVMGDVLAIARGHQAFNTGFVEHVLPPADILPEGEASSRYYLRFTLPDRPGVLSEVSGVMGRHGISIAQAVQKGDRNEQDGVPIVFLTHEAKGSSLTAALEELEKSGILLGEYVRFRVI